jgi:hypothetical protein
MSDETFSRDEVAAWAGLTRPQLNHFHKIGLCVSDVGGVRKRISRQEAALTAGVAAFVRQGVQPKNLVAAFNWLREQIASDEQCARRWNYALNGPPEGAEFPEYAILDFWFAIFADDEEWEARWSNTGAPIEGKEGCSMINFRMVLSNRGFLGGRNG